VGPLQGRPLTALLQIAGLTVRYGATAAVDGLDLTIARGELFVLLGGSGSGKTTLLRAVAGFVQPDAGRITLDGQELAGVPPYRRPVNTMFQSYALFPHMTVAQNVAFGLRGLGRGEARARVAAMLDLVSMGAYAGRKPAQLSGGQQQRVALARSLAPNPRLLLLDEPLSALDRGLREQTRGELVALQRRLGIGFILVTHDQQEALTMATRIGVMQDGSLRQVGTPAEVYERPASRFVAEFLGAANILPARVRERSGQGSVLEVCGATVHAASPAPADGPVLLAIRPERLRLLPADGAMAAGNRLAGTVSESAYAGDALLHTVRLADGTEMRVTAPLGDGLAAARVAVGTAVTLGWAPEACIVLPA
jgi:spermidine/putrescine ABC transporter ATP-binding subunit